MHILFQVNNFIFSDSSAKYNLLPNDKLLLILLAKYHGPKGICPSQETLAKDMKCSSRYIRERSKYLQSIGVISIKKISSLAHYFFNFITDVPEVEFRSPQKTPDLQFRSDSKSNQNIPQTPEPQFRSGVKLSTDTGTGVPVLKDTHRNPSSAAPEPQRRDTGTGVPVINLYNQLRSEKRESKERSLLSFFEPDETNKILCRDLRLDLAQQAESFLNRHKGKKTQYEFTRWLKAAKEYADRNKPKEEMRSTVPWLIPDPMKDPTGYDAYQQQRRRPVANQLPVVNNGEPRHADTYSPFS